MNEQLNLDPAALERLHRLGGGAFVAKMIELFIDYAGTKITEARSAYLAHNLEAVGRAVHPVKSSAGNVGAARVQEWALRVEVLSKQADPVPVAAGLNELERAFAAVKPELQQRKREAEVALPAGDAQPQPRPATKPA